MFRKIITIIALSSSISIAIASDNSVATLSVSSDGSYAVTTNMNRHAYLWDLKHKTVKDLGSPYNIYSAYFVPNTNYFLLQNDKTNQVIVSDTNNHIIKTIQVDYPTYGQAITSDLSQYVSANRWFDIYQQDLKTNEQKQLFVSWCYAKEDHTPYNRQNPYKGGLPNGCTGYNGQLMSFVFAPNTLIATFTSSFIVYDTQNRKWKDLNVSNGQTMNAISPDGKYVYTADQQFLGAKYDLENQKLVQFPKNGKNPNNFWVNIANLEAKPVKENKAQGNTINQLTNFRFIDNTHYLATANSVPYPFMWVGLFDNNDIAYREYSDGFKFTTNNALKYLPLVKDPDTFTKGVYGNYPSPYPTTGGFNMTFDTSPSAHILVTAQANGDGIMVYQYHADKQSLELVWSPSIGG